MKIFLDTANIAAIKLYNDMGLVDGITTNPSLLAKEGAKYVSPFIGRLDDNGQDGIHLIKEMREVFKNYAFSTQILVASVRHTMHVVEAAKIGADVVTLPPEVLGKMLKHTLTDVGLKNFLADWEKLKKENPSIRI